MARWIAVTFLSSYPHGPITDSRQTLRVAVTGATGQVAEFLIPLLLENHHEVHALWHSDKRKTEKFGSFDRLHWYQGDLMDLVSLQKLTTDCDAVVHAALEHVSGRYRGGEGDDPARFRDVNLHKTEAFLKMLQGTQVKRTVFISSRAVFDGYGESTSNLNDATPTNPESLYGEIKARTEDLGNSLAGIGFSTLRPTGIYGETHRLSDNKWSALIADAKADDVSGEVYSNQLRTEVHGEDVASAILLLLTAPLEGIQYRCFNCSDIAVSQAQLVDLMRKVMNEQSVELDALPVGIPPNNPMACDGLTELGWKPGGMAKLLHTLQHMLSVPS